MINNKLSWINLNATGGSGGTGGVSDYNQLANRPIKTLTGTTQSPIKLWKLDTGLYILNGYVQHTNELASEAKGLFTSVVAGVMNGSYVVSAFIPFWEGQYEYLLDSLASANYNEHQVVMILTQDDVLTLTNENEYTPTKDYHPSTKKYVDDMIVNFREELNEIGVNEENIESLIAENRRRDIAIQALLSQNSDKMVTVEEDTHIIPMDYSIDNGMAIINKMEGSTLVNVANQKEEIGLSYGQNNVASYSNEIVTEQDTTVNPILEGNTVVNVANQRSKVVVTKEYDTVENSNHIAVPNTVDEKIRPIVEGNTLVNLAPSMSEGKWILNQDKDIAHFSVYTNKDLFKPSTVYTVVILDAPSSFTGSLIYGIGDTREGLVYTFTSITELYNERIHIYARNEIKFQQGDLDNIKIMVFEGDLTANPPSGYIEGLKSTFEDKKIPDSLITDTEYTLCNVPNNVQIGISNYPSFYIEGNIRIRTNLISVKPNTTYTACTQLSELTIHQYDIDNLATISAVWTGSNIYSFTTSSNTVGVVIYARGGVDNPSLENRINEFKPILLEGDWSSNPPTYATYEDVMNYEGKYKVEYNVVGKNKFDINNVVSMSYGTYLIEGNTLTITSAVTNEKNCFINYEIDNLKDGQTYIINFQGEGEKNPNEPWCQIVDENGLHYNQYNKEPLKFIAKGKMTLRFYASVGTNSTKSVKYWNIQLEEGTQATEYEPYKSYTKTFYLNSPLLEGDTIEEIDGVATHVHRYGKVVFDGSNNDWGRTNDGRNDTDTTMLFSVKMSNWKKHTAFSTSFYCDTMPVKPYSEVVSPNQFIGLTCETSFDALYFRIYKSSLNEQSLNGFKQWLQANPTTVVYELATPTYETISSSDTVIDSYANGHLDYNTIVPISSTKFVAYSKEMVYLNKSTSYTIQFNSDSIGTVDITLGGNKVEGKGIVQGLNQIEIATPSTLIDNMLIIEGDNVGISELIVTPLNSANPTYGYFEGLQSCFEEQLVKNEDSPYYGKYRVEYRSNADVKTVYLNSPLFKGDKIEEVDGKLYHYHKMDMLVLDGNEGWSKHTISTDTMFIGWLDNGRYNKTSTNWISDKYPYTPELSTEREGISLLTSGFAYLHIHSNRLVTPDISGFRQWFNENPVTVVYQLKEPYYEEISPSQILVRTSANGKLSFNSDIPLASIQLVPYEQELTYLYASTVYTVQFVANANCNVNATLGGATLQNQAVTVGLNKIQITTPSTLVDNKLRLDVIGNCKISELVVTNSTEEFGYFEGMKSTFEDTVGEEGYNAEVIIYNAPIRFGKGGRL